MSSTGTAGAAAGKPAADITGVLGEEVGISDGPAGQPVAQPVGVCG